AVQRHVPSQDGEQERAGPASNIEQPAMPRKVVIGRQCRCRRRGKGFDPGRKDLLFLGAELAELRPPCAGAHRFFQSKPAWVADAVPEAQHRPQVRAGLSGEKGRRGLAVAIALAITLQEADAYHRVGADARGAPRDATCSGEFVERCRTLRETSEQSDFASDKQMLRSHEAHGDPHDRIGCDLSHYVPPLRRNTAGPGRNPAQIAQTAASMSTWAEATSYSPSH